jgi:hypothetical protein
MKFVSVYRNLSEFSDSLVNFRNFSEICDCLY